ARDKDSYFTTFYLRRVHRIFPPYFIWLGAFLVGLYFGRTNISIPFRDIYNTQLPIWSYFLFCQNLFMTWLQTFGPQWMGITWSLAVEEQFYLILPWLVRRTTTRSLVVAAMLAIVMAPVLRLVLYYSGNIYFAPYTLLPCRSDALACGVLAAIGLREKPVWDWLASHRNQLYLAFTLFALGSIVLIVRSAGRLMTSVGY